MNAHEVSSEDRRSRVDAIEPPIGSDDVLRSATALPPLAPADAGDDERGRAIEARMVARHGAPSTGEYRRAYAGFGAEWPGDDEIRRRHLVAPDSAA